MFGLGTGELAMILVILFFVFGAKRLPALGKALGQGMRDFGRSLKGMDEEEEKSRSKNEMYKSQNVTYFVERIGSHPERIKNLYFVYAATLRAVSLMRPKLLEKYYVSGLDDKVDEKTQLYMKKLLDVINEEDCDQAFSEQKLFTTEKEGF